MKYVAALLVLLLASSFACANSISYVTVSAEDSGKVHVKEVVSVSDMNTVGPLMLISDASEISVYDAYGPIEYQTYEVDGKSTNLVVEAPARSVKEFFVEYSTNVLTSKSDSVWRINFNLQSTASRTIIKVEFPSNSTILNWTPYRFSVGPDILYIYPDVNETNFTATYQFGGGKQTVTPLQEQPISPLYVAVFALAVIAVLVAYILIKRRQTARPGITIAEMEVRHDGDDAVVSIGQEVVDKNEQGSGSQLKESVEKMLEDNERKVVDVLANHADEITQAQVYHTTGIPKASLSDIMNRLERRNIIERTKEGRVKWVKLKKWVYK
ncbi:MAG: MarR family transcriptional regulator [Candidatus Altiarchaeota archaeon]